VLEDRLTALKSYCFPDQSISDTFIIHSSTYSPSINGYDSFAIICEIEKLEGNAATLDLV
jgi:hypothetical protein